MGVGNGRLDELFAEHLHLRPVIDCVLEGVGGEALTDGASDPRVARLDIGCYSFFGGDPHSASAAPLIRTIEAPRELVFPDSDAWRTTLHRILDPDLTDRPMQSFSSEELDLEAVKKVATNVPAGFDVRPVDAQAASQLDESISPHALQVFTPEEFLAVGRGFCAWEGDRLACAATSYTICSHGIELAIATHPDYRRRGLARVVAAALIVDCLRTGLSPFWTAANPISQRIATDLGYLPAGQCEVLFLDRA